MIDWKRFLVAVAAAIPLAFLGLVSGLILMGALVVATVFSLFTFGRAVFAGLAVGLGVTWALMFAMAAVSCAGPDHPCGATPINLVPHILLSVGLAAVGAAVLVAAARVEHDDGRLRRKP